MEKHKCKLCFRSFSNGRALGGHMRSHMMNLPLPTKPEVSSSPPTIQHSFEAESASSSEDEEGGDDDDKSLCYGLRENPKRSIRFEGPEFSFAAADTGSVILQDRESETESSKNPTRRRSKRAWKLGVFDQNYDCNNKKQVHEREAMMKKMKLCKASKTESWVVNHEPVSSVSDATTEEDVAFCLMMLSRDKWKRQKDQQQLVEDKYEEEEEEQVEEDEDEDEEDEVVRSLEDSDESEELRLSKNRVQGRYKCETCNKVFRSYQALGGHRASHKKIKMKVTVDDEPELEHENGGACAPMVVEKKIHECPVCFRVFASGQALGGHKRTHVTGSAATTPVPSSIKLGKNLIDLNLPAPIDDDDISQIENSAVSDAEFVKTH